MNSLKRVLQAAVAAPGNRERFEAAGLIADTGDRVHLVDDWQAAFLRLHPIAKETIRQDPSQFLASADDIVYRGNTSGTRGQHFVYFADSEWNRARLKARQTSLSWWGIDDQTPILNLGSRLLPVRPVDMTLVGVLTSEFIDQLLHQLATTPAVIRGYPSRLCAIATALIERQRPVVLGVICTGECLYDFQKVLLEQVFVAPVINEYGCQESGISGLTCPEAGRLHLDSDRCLYEIIQGQLVTTDLFNVVMPMIRYQCGDVLQLHPDPCPCGRSEPTAIVQGRVEDVILTQQGQAHLGEVQMPAFSGVLHYQVIRGQAKTTLRVWPHPGQSPLDLHPLMQWVQDQFGVVDLQVAIDRTCVIPSPPIQTCDDQAWIDRVTLGSWSTVLSQPQLPEGEGQTAAKLLHDLMNPAVIRYHGLPASSWALLQAVNLSAIANSRMNEIVARIVLFACSFLWNDPSVKQIYHQAVQRLKPALKAQPGHVANLDRLIPTLFLDTAIALAIWTDWLQEMDSHSSDELITWQVDTFVLQHTLQAFEAAVQRAWQTPSHVFRSLRPFLSVLIGDLSFFAPQLAPWLLGYWFELLHQQPLPPSPWLKPPDPEGFEQVWLTWRRQLMQTPQQASLCELQAVVRSPEAQERVMLEQGYRVLIQGQLFKPEPWISILHHIGEPPHSPTSMIDIVPWQPILKALVKPLFEQGQPDWAYDCLRATMVLSSRISAFERLASQWNDKQYVLYQFLTPE
jgi:hypothetical protein